MAMDFIAYYQKKATEMIQWLFFGINLKLQFLYIKRYTLWIKQFLYPKNRHY